MKNILIVITNFRHGGTNRSLKNLLSIIDHEKYSVDVFAMDHFGPYSNQLPNCILLKPNKLIDPLIACFDDTKGMARIRSLSMKIIRNLLQTTGFNLTNYLFKRKANQFSKGNYDAVIAFSEGAPTYLVYHVKNNNKIAWIRCDYGSYLKYNNCPNEAAIYASYDSVVCVSEFTKEVFCKYISSLSDRVYSIHNIVDAHFMQHAADERISDPRFTNDQFNIISIGRIDQVKRFSKIPQIVRLLIDRGCQFKWYLIGDGSQSTELTEFKNNIKKFNVANSFFWLGAKDNPYPYIAQSDLLVTTSSSEACPNVINEAKILHIPVVCTNFGSAPEFIEDGVNGYIAPIEQLADKIELLIKDKQEYNKIKKNLAEFIYDNEQILKRLYRILP